jgi:hypothetical protein
VAGDRDDRLRRRRVQINVAGHLELSLKTPWRGGTTHMIVSPLATFQRLAALVSLPKLQRAGRPECGLSRATVDGRYRQTWTPAIGHHCLF